MNINELESKWNGLKSEGTGGYKSLRLSGDCIPDLYIGVDVNSGRCLILKLPVNNSADFQSVIKQNLSIELHRETQWIVLKLLNNTFADLFNDLILSLFNKIKSVRDVKEYTAILIETFYKWSEFFEDNNIGRLSEESILGIFGEVLFLSDIMKQTEANSINDVMASWKGLYDTGHDFIFKEQNVEVKTKDLHGLDVRISSEYQLEPESEKALKLAVVNVLKDNNGLSLSDVVTITKQLVVERLGDFTIILKALAQKGLTYSNVKEYDNFKYQPANITFYDCKRADFPKIVHSEIPELLHNVKYNIRISALNNFIIDKKNF